MVKGIPSSGFYGNGHKQRRRQIHDENEMPIKRNAIQTPKNKPPRELSLNTHERFYSDINTDILSDREKRRSKNTKLSCNGHISRNQLEHPRYKKSLDIREVSTAKNRGILSHSKRPDKLQIHLDFSNAYDADEQMSFGPNQIYSLGNARSDTFSKSHYSTPVKTSKLNSHQRNEQILGKHKKFEPLHDTKRCNFNRDSSSDRERLRERDDSDESEGKENIPHLNDPPINTSAEVNSINTPVNGDANETNDEKMECDVTYDPNCPLPLKNFGNTCYVNSIVQSTFVFPFFLNDLIRCAESISSKDTIRMTQTLVDFYRTYDGLRNKQNDYSMSGVEEKVKSLKDCVGNKFTNFKDENQEDAAEFFEAIIEMIQEEFDANKDSQLHNPINKYFDIRLSKTLMCHNRCNVSKVEVEYNHTVYLSMPENMSRDYSLQDAVYDYFNDESRTADCEVCGAKEKILSTQIIKLPKILFMQLARYSGNDNDKRDEKVKAPYKLFIPSLYSRAPSIDSTPVAPSPVPTPFRAPSSEKSKSSSKIKKKLNSVKRRILSDDSDNEVIKADDIPIQNGEYNGNVQNVQENDHIPQTDGTGDDRSLPLINDKSEESFILNGELKHMFNDSDASKEEISFSESKCETPLSKNNSDIMKTPQKGENFPLGNGTPNNDINREYRDEEYRLAAVVCHYGSSLSRGHYYCYVRNIQTQKWFLCNDTEIKEIEVEKVLKRCESTGYLFFYMHKKL